MNLVQKYPCFLLFLLALLSSCGKLPTSGSSYVGASSQSVSITNDYPGVVMILLPGGRGLCTGTVISPKAVLTAAHCAKNLGVYQIITSFGLFKASTIEKLGQGVLDDPNDIAVLIADDNFASAEKGQIHSIGEAVVSGDTIQIVGYGCNDLSAKTGSGKKRTGTNYVYTISDYIELRTPEGTTAVREVAARGILGPENRAGSCFGDSGGPMFQSQHGRLALVGATHAGGSNGESITSQYVNLNRSDNMDFLHRVDTTYRLRIFDSTQSAFIQIVTFLQWIWSLVQAWFL